MGAVVRAESLTSRSRGTIRPTLLFTPRRSVVVAAKVAAIVLAGFVLAAVEEALSVRVGEAILLRGGIGIGLGLIVRDQVAAVIGLLGWGFVVETLLFALVPSVDRLTPGEAQNARMGSRPSTCSALPPAGSCCSRGRLCLRAAEPH